MSVTTLAMILALTSSAQAQQNAPPTVVDDVEVVGRRLGDLVESFVDEMAPPPLSQGMPRWHHSVCVGVSNLRPEVAQPIVDRISSLALDVGLIPEEPGCSPNILIMATDDGPGLARALVAERRNTFRPNYASAARSVRQLQRFQDRDDAVRWWHVSMPVQRDTGVPAVKLPGQAARPIANRGGLLTTEIRNDLRRAFIIIDVSKIDGMNWTQVSDYVAMTALAQVDPEADLRAYPTILNVMRDPQAAASLTDWDRQYLMSLYGLELNQRGAHAQGGAVASLMTRQVRADRSARTEPAADSSPQP